MDWLHDLKKFILPRIQKRSGLPMSENVARHDEELIKQNRVEVFLKVIFFLIKRYHPIP
jgi:hypothetical protein